MSASDPPPTLLLVEDDPVVRTFLADNLTADGYDLLVADTVLDAVRLLEYQRPDLAVIDLRLSDGSGLDVCREVRSRDPKIAALVLTSYDDDEALFSAIMAGAAGYVLKQVRGQDLLDAVRRVAAGQSLLDPAVTQQVLDRLREGPKQDKALAGLTDQERRVLELIGEGLTNRAIGERLARLATNTQLLVVTHSPQVAARGAHHLLIAKSHDGIVTRTDVTLLDERQRREEIARMLSGATITDEARAQAGRLLEAA